MAADIITILTCFGPTSQFVVVNVILTLRSHLFITDAKSLRYHQHVIAPLYDCYKFPSIFYNSIPSITALASKIAK